MVRLGAQESVPGLAPSSPHCQTTAARALYRVSLTQSSSITQSLPDITNLLLYQTSIIQPQDLHTTLYLPLQPTVSTHNRQLGCPSAGTLATTLAHHINETTLPPRPSSPPASIKGSAGGPRTSIIPVLGLVQLLPLIRSPSASLSIAFKGAALCATPSWIFYRPQVATLPPHRRNGRLDRSYQDGELPRRTERPTAW